MKNRRLYPVARVVYCLTMSAFFLALAAGEAAGQRPVQPSNPDPKRGMRDRERREAMLRKSETAAEVEKRDQKRIAEAVEKVREDFKQIQIVRNGIVRKLIANQPLDYKVIAEESAEIHKRADRMKTYMLPPVPDDQDKSYKSQIEFDKDEMKDALVRLCNMIAVFVDNPAFKAPGTTDVEQSTKAGGELLSIIELSSNIKRSAEKLNKAQK
ncbi:MAG TPA: hypothetical protein VE262_05180 [Blastocatellia bacterium]|nr:hypothetical protein [Blastocatellia bacterium]